MGLLEAMKGAPTSERPLTRADVEDALNDLWETVDDSRPQGCLLCGPEWYGGLWLESDGVWRGNLWHTEHGLFPAAKTGDGPVVIEGWEP